MPHSIFRTIDPKPRRALGLAKLVTFGTILVAGVAGADSRAASALSGEAQVAQLFEQGMGEPAVPASESAEEAVRQATQQQVAALRGRGKESRALSREISRRVDAELALLTSELGGRARSLAPERDARLSSAVDRRAARSGRIESGSLALPLQTSSEGRSDGIELGRYRFARPFDHPPRVALGMRESELAADEPRVALRVVQVDEAGFDYELRSWGSSRVTDLTADWVALAHPPAQDPVPSKMR